MIDVRATHVSKRYVLREASWRALLPSRMRRREPSREFWALRDISFDVLRGEALGIIGHNGAGKSTMLKILSGITAPTSGEIAVSGRLSALIEVGSGFHPELTGRENVYLSGSILGMRRREIAAKLDRIVDFAGVGQFIDTPVKWYSSGMYVRLGFAIAAHLEPDVLLVDEVLAVGDAEFQAKCLRRIDDLKQQGTTIIFISHDLTTIERLCDRAILLQRGGLAASGAPRDVTAEYHRRLSAGTADSPPSVHPAWTPTGIELTGLEFAAPGERGPARTGAPLVTRLRYQAAGMLEDLAFEVTFFSPDGSHTIAQCSTDGPGRRLDVPAGKGAVEFDLPALGLQPGAYYVGAAVKQRGASYNLHWWDGGTMLHVEPGRRVRGQFYMLHEWRVVPEPADKPSAAAGTNSRRGT
jgi:ABC-type polysaccharide/polyol phosphate transport system ATPase subunit